MRDSSNRSEPFDWLPFLEQWNAELLASEFLAEVRRYHTSDELEQAIVAGWLGYPGATEAELAATEARIGARLPSSYRAFLAASNGWLWPDRFIPKLWATAEIDWLATRHQGAIEAWRDGESVYGPPTVPDAEYFIYGNEQAFHSLRSEYLQTALDISTVEIHGTAMCLLNPQVTRDGDWEAWYWAHWLPGARRYRSFRKLIVALRRSIACKD